MTTSHPLTFILQWHLTERCNLRCRHCYQEGQGGAELSQTEIYSIIDEAAGMLKAWEEAYGLSFAPVANVTGGEPFLRAGLFEIMARLAGAGFALNLLTNGILATPERAKLLKDLKVAEVQVSLEGPQDIHDQIRGPGSFAAALAGVRIFLEAGLKVSLNTTLSRLNFQRFPELLVIARSVGVPEVGFSRLVPSGQGQTLIGKMLSPVELEDFYRRMLAPPAGDVAVICGDPLAAQLAVGQDPGDLGEVPCGGCAAAISGLTLLPDGTILPCRRLAIPLGNANRDSLREIWALHPVLTALRDRSRYPGKCGACARWAVCRGCRAVAHAWSQAEGTPDPLAPDPQCFVEPGAGPDA